MTGDEQDRVVADFLRPLERVEPASLGRRSVRRAPRAGRVTLVVASALALGLAVAAVALRRPEAERAPGPAATTQPAVTAAEAATVTVSRTKISKRTASGAVTELPGEVLAAAPSPDRTLLAYLASDAGGRCTLRLLDLRSWTSRDLDACPDPGNYRPRMDRPIRVVAGDQEANLDPWLGPTWSPDGGTILYGCHEDFTICALDVRSSRREALIDSAAVAATFSPDGSQIAYLRPAPTGARLQVWVAARDGSGARRIATGKQDCCRATHPQLGFTPDGDQLVVWGVEAEVVDLATGAVSGLPPAKPSGGLGRPLEFPLAVAGAAPSTTGPAAQTAAVAKSIRDITARLEEGRGRRWSCDGDGAVESYRGHPHEDPAPVGRDVNDIVHQAALPFSLGDDVESLTRGDFATIVDGLCPG